MSVLHLGDDAYHGDETGDDRPSLSRSIAHILWTQSPAHAWAAHPKLNPDFVRTESETFDLGNAAHDLLLRGEARVEVVYEKDWKKQLAQQARVDARLQGKLPLLESQWERTQAMVAACREQLAVLDADPPVFSDGDAEVTLTWEEDGGVLCRARLDWLRTDHKAIDDYKSTGKSANPYDFSRTLYNVGYDMQAAFYLRGLRKVTGVTDAQLRFVAQESTPPYLLSVSSLPPDGMAIAERKVQWAIDTWRRCLETGQWPGYPSRVCYAEPPGWEETQLLEREMRDAA